MPIFTVGAAGTTSSGYEVANSLRFNSGSNDSITRTFGSTSNRRTYTVSFWLKKTDVTTEQHPVFAGDLSGSNPYFDFRFDSSQIINWYHSDSGGSKEFNLKTNAVFKDPSAWYHFVLALDTTQATASNRVKLYVNGVQITSFSEATYPAQNFDTAFNVSGYEAQFGAIRNNSPTLNGYMSEVVMIDGQQLDPTSFGEFDSVSGIWKPIDVSGLTFGTNGFYLKFNNSFDKHTLTANGDVKHSTAQNKIGATSIAFDGTNDWITVTDHPDFDFGTSAFTIEMWVRMDSSSTNYSGLFTMDNPQCSFRINAQGRIQFLQDHGGTRGNTDDNDTSGTNLRDDAWHHVAMVREGDATWDLYVDGTSEYSGTGMTGNITGHSDIVIGRRADSNSNYLTGYLDEIRVSKVARYTSNFTPSTTAFDDDNDTILLIHSDTTNNSTTFTDSSGAVSSLGNETSGNGNHFTVNNITNVAQSTDTCTNNYCTFMYNHPTVANFTLTEGGLKVSKSGAATLGLYGSSIMPSTGKWYWEVKFVADAGSDRTRAGLAAYESVTGTSTIQGSYSGFEFTCTTGGRFSITENGTTTEIDGFNGYATGDIIRFALDLDNTKLYIGRNGDWFNYNSSATGGDPTSGSGWCTNSAIALAGPVTIYAGHSVGASGSMELNYNFGSPPYSISSGNSDGNGHGNFEYAVPSGYYALNSKNLAEFG